MLTTAPIDSDSWLAIESPDFAVRFGSLLAATRRRSKRSMGELAASSLVGFDASQLEQFERGSATIDESIVAALCLAYSADIGQILPARLPVAISEGRLSGGGLSVRFSPDDPTSLMVAYLRLIRRMRNQKKAPAIELRREDILALALYLDIDGAAVVERLSTLMHATAAQRKTMAMLFATGAIVIGLATGGHAAAAAGTSPTAVTSPATADTSDGQPVSIESQPDRALERDAVVITDAPTFESAPPVTETVAGPVASPVAVPVAETTVTVAEPAVIVAETAVTVAEPVAAVAGPTQAAQVEPELLATALTASTAVEAAPVAGVDRGAAAAGLSTATRLQVPVATPPLTVAAEAPTPNRSNCNPDPSEAVMSVVIPDIAYSCPVYAGGQPMIDAGFVTLVTDAGVNPVLATRPGDPGTLWLAGHRTTRGAAFADVPNLADGALVTVSAGNATATYRVVGRSYVEVSGGRVIDGSGRATAAATWASIIRSDFGGNLAPRLVLQTCEGEDFRWMIYADLVTG